MTQSTITPVLYTLSMQFWGKLWCHPRQIAYFTDSNHKHMFCCDSIYCKCVLWQLASNMVTHSNTQWHPILTRSWTEDRYFVVGKAKKKRIFAASDDCDLIWPWNEMCQYTVENLWFPHSMLHLGKATRLTNNKHQVYCDNLELEGKLIPGYYKGSGKFLCVFHMKNCLLSMSSEVCCSYIWFDWVTLNWYFELMATKWRAEWWHFLTGVQLIRDGTHLTMQVKQPSTKHNMAKK